MRFIVGEDTKPLVVELEQDGEDVNILVNGVRVAFFSDDPDDDCRGALHLFCLCDEEAEKARLARIRRPRDGQNRVVKIV